jgi:hypothetical protein
MRNTYSHGVFCGPPPPVNSTPRKSDPQVTSPRRVTEPRLRGGKKCYFPRAPGRGAKSPVLEAGGLGLHNSEYSTINSLNKLVQAL